MPKLRSLDLDENVVPSGYSIAAVAQLTALTHLSMRDFDTQHLQDLTRLSSLGSLESLRLAFCLRRKPLQVSCLS